VALHCTTIQFNQPCALPLAQAARVRCTVGEISDALERAWGRHSASSGVISGTYAQVGHDTHADCEPNRAAHNREMPGLFSNNHRTELQVAGLLSIVFTPALQLSTFVPMWLHGQG
jgi:hypothetical protein